MNYKEDILMEMRLHRLEPQNPDQLIADGQIHRYRIAGNKPGTKNGWYTLHIAHLHDARMVVYAVFGCWKLGVKHTWVSGNSKKLTGAEQVQLTKKINAAKMEYERQKKRQQIRSAEVACKQWHLSVVAEKDHPYLIRKCIRPYIAQQIDNNLILPIIDHEQKIWSLQYISADGKKLFLSGGAKKGNFIPIQGWINEPCIGIAEGFATCATLADMHVDMCLISALDAYNLEPVARVIRMANPNAEIVIFGDDDRQTDGNPGATMARRAAVASGAELVLPSWPCDAPLALTDFNDLHCWLVAKAKGIL
jgi:putative DNA primase/helicase